LDVELASLGPGSRNYDQQEVSDSGKAVEQSVRLPTRQKDDLVGIGSMFR
jgi:hypothetical protein